MSSHFSRTLLAAILFTLTVCALPVWAEEPAFDNPLILQRADPFVMRHSDGNYYFTATSPKYDEIEIRRAKTIQELNKGESKVVWHKHVKGEMGAHIWAPEMHFIDGKWYIYFAAGAAEKVWDIRIYVLTNASADPFKGDWSECGKLKTNWESFTLDATPFAVKGVWYLVWAQSDDKVGKGTNLYIAKMSSPTALEGKQVMLTKPELPWETIGHFVNEGPAPLIHNGKIFLTYSASATDSHYCMGMLTANLDSELLDPKSWAKSSQPVFTTNEANGIFGPGHNSFTTTPDGKTDVLIYHARDYKEIKGDPLNDVNRATRAQVVRWKADGTPDFGVPAKDAAKK
jgi:GH43 family beta-xylosidase